MNKEAETMLTGKVIGMALGLLSGILLMLVSLAIIAYNTSVRLEQRMEGIEGQFKVITPKVEAATEGVTKLANAIEAGINVLTIETKALKNQLEDHELRIRVLERK